LPRIIAWRRLGIAIQEAWNTIVSELPHQKKFSLLANLAKPLTWKRSIKARGQYYIAAFELATAGTTFIH